MLPPEAAAAARWERPGRDCGGNGLVNTDSVCWPPRRKSDCRIEKRSTASWQTGNQGMFICGQTHTSRTAVQKYSLKNNLWWRTVPRSCATIWLFMSVVRTGVCRYLICFIRIWIIILHADPEPNLRAKKEYGRCTDELLSDRKLSGVPKASLSALRFLMNVTESAVAGSCVDDPHCY